MKKLMYLFVAGTVFAFAACNCGAGDSEATDSVEEVVACADDCQKACCLGCKATEGEKKCIVLADGSMPCCHPPKEEHDDHPHDHPPGHDHTGHDHK